MSDPQLVTGAALGLTFLLGLRHGLDPDHIAIIDGFAFRAAEERPRLAPWVGTLFAIGHSLSVAVVVGVAALISRQFAWPQWISEVADWAVIGLLFLLGMTNLVALRRPHYRPLGWRSAFLPKRLRNSSEPFTILAVGAIFGLVFETATQAAAWGAAAAGSSGMLGALAIAASFAAGMILTDTADSRIISSLMKSGDAARIGAYRRSVGYLIVVLALGMATYTLAAKLLSLGDPPEMLFTLAGALMVITVAATLVSTRLRATPKARMR